MATLLTPTSSRLLCIRAAVHVIESLDASTAIPSESEVTLHRVSQKGYIDSAGAAARGTPFCHVKCHLSSDQHCYWKLALLGHTSCNTRSNAATFHVFGQNAQADN